MTKNPSLIMRRNCNLDLRLSPTFAAASDHPSAAVSATANGSQQSQQLTIFYNGRICVCDVTEIQAIAILKLATRENEEKASNESKSLSIPQSSPIPQTSITPELSMKRSLKRFLQKRKHRIQETSPYNP